MSRAEARLRPPPAWQPPCAALPEPVNDADYLQGIAGMLLHGPRRVTRWAFWLTLLFWIAAIGWAALVHIDEYAVAEGTVVPSSRVQLVQNLEGGIVAEVLVKTGDRVEKGQPLLRMDRVRFASASQEGQARDRALLARIARLSAESAGLPFTPPATRCWSRREPRCMPGASRRCAPMSACCGSRPTSASRSWRKSRPGRRSCSKAMRW